MTLCAGRSRSLLSCTTSQMRAAENANASPGRPDCPCRRASSESGTKRPHRAAHSLTNSSGWTSKLGSEVNLSSKKSSRDAPWCLSGLGMESKILLMSSRSTSVSFSNGVLLRSRTTKRRTVRRGSKSFMLTSKTVLSRGFPEPLSRPMSWHHMFTRSTSATAMANSAVFFSNAVSSSPRSLPSLPSRSMISVASSSLEDLCIQMPCVVWLLPSMASISTNPVPKRLLRSVDLPELCGPMMATVW
mmetsp:Transcript_64636/g.204049  ORF Transcript_64636/g.204049 Transcript_64636/m.204049 type:complete len:245 (+) Transcript_64636:443-1177(+)